MFVNKRFTKEVYVCKNVRYNEYCVFLNNFNKKFSENVTANPRNSDSAITLF